MISLLGAFGCRCDRHSELLLAAALSPFICVLKIFILGCAWLLLRITMEVLQAAHACNFLNITKAPIHLQTPIQTKFSLLQLFLDCPFNFAHRDRNFMAMGRGEARDLAEGSLALAMIVLLQRAGRAPDFMEHGPLASWFNTARASNEVFLSMAIAALQRASVGMPATSETLPRVEDLARHRSALWGMWCAVWAALLRSGAAKAFSVEMIHVLAQFKNVQWLSLTTSAGESSKEPVEEVALSDFARDFYGRVQVDLSSPASEKAARLCLYGEILDTWGHCGFVSGAFVWSYPGCAERASGSD